MIESISCPPYSEVVHILDGHRITKGFIDLLFYFFFLAVMALGVLLLIDCLMVA